MTSASRLVRRALLALLPCACVAVPASAQQPTPPGGGLMLTTQDTFKGIKNHVSFMLSGGFDLDVFGDVISGALGQRADGAELAIRATRPYPDVYVALPRRAQIALGFGLTQHNEIVARLSKATYTSEPLTDAGNFVGPEGEGGVTMDVSQCRERSWEVGWRHYMMMTKRVKQYANILGGVRTIQPISAAISTEPTGPIGDFRLYDLSKVKTLAVEVGLTVELKGHAGVFAEVGAHAQQKLKRDDEDLKTWGLEPVNNTGGRFYMPFQVGFIFRL
jgi:hypothetical protein